MKTSKDQLISDLSSVVDATLARHIVDEYVDMNQRYHAGDWGPAELNGGKFCEAIARAMFELDSGSSTIGLPGAIADQLRTKTLPHKLHEKERDHFCRVLQTVYKLRNDRGVAHISPIHSANLMDAMLVISTVKWMLGEFLRLAQGLNREEVVQIIEDIVQLEHPLIHELNGKPLVQSTSLSAPEEVLILLQHAVGGSLTADQLREAIPKSSQAVNIAIRRLRESRQIRADETGMLVITPLGRKRTSEQILPRLQQVLNFPARSRSAVRRKQSKATSARK